MNDDLIIRSALIERINTVLSDLVIKGELYSYEVYDTILAMIDVAPAVDAVEVVRCKDCKHWIVDSFWNGNPEQVRACRFAGWMVGANGYCVYGERNNSEDINASN